MTNMQQQAQNFKTNFGYSLNAQQINQEFKMNNGVIAWHMQNGIPVQGFPISDEHGGPIQGLPLLINNQNNTLKFNPFEMDRIHLEALKQNYMAQYANETSLGRLNNEYTSQPFYPDKNLQNFKNIQGINMPQNTLVPVNKLYNTNCELIFIF